MALRAAHGLVALLMLAGVVACGGPKDGESHDAKIDETSSELQIPVPESVTLTEPGIELSRDEPASLVWDAGSEAVSVITVRLKEIEQGDIKDFRFFSLSKKQENATPYYVTMHVSNDGPAGLGGRVPPVRLLTADNTTWLPNPIYGDLDACGPTQLPDSFLPNNDIDMCLVYLVDQGAPTRLNVQGTSDSKPVYWPVPDDIGDASDDDGSKSDGSNTQ